MALSASEDKMLMMSLIVSVLTLTCSLQMKQCEDKFHIIEQCNRRYRTSVVMMQVFAISVLYDSTHV